MRGGEEGRRGGEEKTNVEKCVSMYLQQQQQQQQQHNMSMNNGIMKRGCLYSEYEYVPSGRWRC